MTSLDLTKLLPPQYRDKTLDTLIKSLFNRHLSKIETIPLFGYIGDELNLLPGDVQLQETDAERQLNQLTPMIYAKHGTEDLITSWPDLINKLSLLSVDSATIGDWFKSTSYNFVPPVDLDKLCNFNQYFWIGHWITSAPMLPYHILGIPNLSDVAIAFTASNPGYYPEYYVIKRGAIGGSPLYAPVPTLPDMTTWPDWALVNLWVHRDDILEFLKSYGGAVNFSRLVQATRPIIEYDDKLKLNTHQTVLGVPADSGSLVLQQKIRISQLPLFDLYERDGSHIGQTSAVFYYQEGSQYPVDSQIQRRVATDANADYLFEHSLYDSTSKKLRFYKRWNGSQFQLRTIWKVGPEVGINYSKYDTSGTLINQDKFKNFTSYYCINVDASSQPSYNPTGLPEYVVIERGGVSDWSIYNGWVHVSQLKRSDLPRYVQAERPIIEFNLMLESQLLTTKTQLNQLPKFKIYRFNDVTDLYEQIPVVSDPNLNDAYLNGVLLARINDLPSYDAILTTPEILANTFEYNNERYLQGLYSGEFLPEKDGAIYGYLGRVVSYAGTGDGVIGSITTAVSSTPEVLTLTATSATTFTVEGSLSGSLSSLTVGSPYTTNGITFSITAGLTPFVAGDKFVVEIKSYIYERRSLFVHVNGVYRTLTSPASILTERQSTQVIDANPSLKDGIWEVPPQIEWNVKNETRTIVKQGDLYAHLTSIIGAQPGLIGSPMGINNWRNLTNRNVGLGGLIKQFDGNAALLISMLLQQGTSPAALLDFARRSYENLFSSIHNFVTNDVPQLLTDAVFAPPQSGNSIDAALVDAFKTSFTSTSPVVSATESVIDDHIIAPFYDTTSSLRNLVITLPYLGLTPKALPRKVLDRELNFWMLVHHDGHRSRLPTVSSNLIRDIVNKPFLRSSGATTPGVIAPVAPSSPYKGQFWFKMTTGELYVFHVASDTGELPASPTTGTYTYDRQSDTLLEWNGSSWISATVTDAWTLVNLDLIEANLTLAIETYLYNNCPPVNPRLDDSLLRANPRYDDLQQQEFERFGVTYGVTDVYGSTYDPSNEFTWNYISVIAPGASVAHAAWQEIYRDVYGTPRPDLEPWFSSGYVSKSTFLADAITLGYLPIGTTDFIPSTMWVSVEPFVRSKLALFGRPTVLSVNVSDGTLLPPYSLTHHVESLVTLFPLSASDRFEYGELGPIETYWRKTLNYLYSEQLTFFRLDPLSWVQNTWGVKYEKVSGYELCSSLGAKESPSDFMLHGDKLATVPELSWFTDNFVVNVNPPQTRTYTFECVSRIDNIFKVTKSVNSSVSFNTGSFSDAYISVTIAPTLRGLYCGEKYTVVVSTDGTFTASVSYSGRFTAEGINQIYVQSSRLSGNDLGISINYSLFKDWDVKLGYRFGGFINTDSLVVKSNDSGNIVSTAYQVLVKENKYYNSAWLHALRIQLVRRGTTELSQGYNVPAIGPDGTPGEDWVFRVDNYDSANTLLSWYVYNLSGERQNFVALDGARTLFNWKRYKQPASIAVHHSPFLITGIQNLINFVFGYADLRAAEGWMVNDQENPVLDDVTKRPLSYQLLIEQMIAQQFSGATAGSSFIINPFNRKVWFKTPHGVLSDLYDEAFYADQETTPTILNVGARKINKSDVRVFRQDDVTELVFDEPAYTLHLLVSEYEHVALFDRYSAESLIYDPFLGQRTHSIFLYGERQPSFTGRLDFGGHFLLGDKMKRNIESSVQSILGLYDTTSTLSTPNQRDRALSLLGFNSKDYFSLRGAPNLTEFRFWQGMIANKGTNFSIDAFTNSKKFKSAKLDEFWAYKVAEYGDARTIERPELKVDPSDCSTEITNYLLLEDDELGLISDYQSNGGFDDAPYDSIPYDTFSIYTSEQAANMDSFDARGSIIINPSDESRWYSYNDIKSLEYFSTTTLATWTFIPDNVEKCYTVLDSKGNPVIADYFEIINTVTQARYYEVGEYVPASDPADYGSPKFERINASTIKILDAALIGIQLKVEAYGPDLGRYKPSTLIDYKNNVTTLNINWWDPARNSHQPLALKQVDYQQDRDPARYNQGTWTLGNERLQNLKPWGEGEVGKIWWDTHGLDWLPYSDSKIYPDIQDRLACWGALADYSSIKVYEWIKSSLSPMEYEQQEGNDGSLAIKYLIKRNRTWYQRVVAWRYSDNPATINRKFIAYQPSSLKLFINSTGTGTAVLTEGSFSENGISQGCKISGAVYSSTTAKTDANLTSVFGLATITSDQGYALGSSVSYNSGPSFAVIAGLTFGLSVNEGILSFRSDVLGQYVLSHAEDVITGSWYITLTHVASKQNQTLEVKDVPLTSGTTDLYEFDQLGLTFAYTANFDRSSGTEATRKQQIAEGLGNTDHDIYLRSSVSIFSPIPFKHGITTLTLLDAGTTVSHYGWIAWKDPITNPGAGPKVPFNKYEPVLGAWVTVDEFLSDLVADIKVRTTEPWTSPSGENWNSYQSSWSEWTRSSESVRDEVYYTTSSQTRAQFFTNKFTFTGSTLSIADLINRLNVFVNGIKLRSDQWMIDDSGAWPTLRITSHINAGDRIRSVVKRYSPPKSDLEFDPSIKDNDPLKLIQWKFDYPHAFDVKRNEQGIVTKSYYFWVIGKSATARGKDLGITDVAALLHRHDTAYAVPQGLKYYNQLDARPARYAMLSIKNLGRYVKLRDAYKLRLTINPTLRNDDNSLSLKNKHSEWKLLRPYQTTKLPRELWDLLTNSLVGETELGQSLPFAPLQKYDDRHGTSERFGFTENQKILVDSEIGKATVKYMIVNTNVDKYVNGQFVPDYISYPGFDINQLDSYLATPTSTRQFMDDLWRYAKPKQLSEIFFAILEDAAAANLQLTDLFKTSFISLNDIRTISSSGN